MVDPITIRRAGFRAVFVFACFVVTFFKLLPLGTEPTRIPAPDLLYVVTAAVVLRRPAYAPAPLIVLVLLITDIMFLRPIGLWPAIALVGFEFIRRKAYGQTELQLPFELTLVPVVFGVMILANALVYAILGIPHPSAATTFLHVVFTAMVYPFAILLVEYVLRIRRPRPGDLEAEGDTL
ncbi:hypothetical protein [Litoreibacter roseus]|uniref:Rod shape-determining protein MreD n=1 Tax=Litoreibacter roseus TaxID=2601869 RepID=A0A6N6JFS0_9RHOB|nr:hypothetical protein [Litoreibacter roseus]GFE65066.1 hypothetical protein KIN_21400 [Litoreibacter roseus]